MKVRYYMKIALGYLFFCASVFVIIYTFTQNMITNYLVYTEGESLYRTASGIAGDLTATDDTEILRQEIQYLSAYVGADCWLVQSDGTVEAYAANYFSNAADAFDNETGLSEFSPEDFGEKSYMTGNLYGTLDREALVAAAVCTLADGSSGYLLLIKPLSKVTAEANSYLNIYFYTTALIFLISFVLIAMLTHFMYGPLYKILEGTKAYATGDFDKKIEVKSNDEIGYLADTLNYMASAISTREEDQRKFISNVSHDFRSPLTSIKGYVEAMLDGTIPPEMQEKYLRIILSETERLQKLTENLLELNRYSEAGMMLDISTFDINRLIREVIPTFEGTCRQKSLQFVLKLEGDVLPVSADRSKIAQVLYNLIDNAVKFSHSDSQIVLQTVSSNNKVQVSVRDFGIGIPADSISKIWDRFYKTDLSRGKDRRGSGLGLAIIKEIIQAHKEHITVVSTEGAGSEFLFTLPLSRKEISS